MWKPVTLTAFGTYKNKHALNYVPLGEGRCSQVIQNGIILHFGELYNYNPDITGLSATFRVGGDLRRVGGAGRRLQHIADSSYKAARGGHTRV